MKSYILVLSVCIFLLADCCSSTKNQKKQSPVRVLLVTGGHDFDRPSLDALMQSLPGIAVTEVTHPDALGMFRPEKRGSYDVVLLYDMPDGPDAISEQEKRDYIDCLQSGKGMVVLHHAYCSYQSWSEYKNIVGGRYHQEPWTDGNGVTYPASTYKHDVKFRVKVVDKNHPVTKGIEDFDILDETYANGSVHPGVHILLATDEQTSTPSIAWINHYGKSKIVTILLGHDNHAWSNPAFVKLLTQSIMWVK